jgi:phage gp45-like
MGRIGNITEYEVKKKGTAPGKSIVVKTEAAGGQERSTEYYQHPGFASGPTPDDVPVEVSVGSGSRIIVASQNYKIEIDVSAGETVIYSVNESGEEIKAEIRLGNDGNISINGDDKPFVTHAELDLALQGLISTLNTQLASIAAGASAAISASGLWSTPLTLGGLQLDISKSATKTVKTGG